MLKKVYIFTFAILIVIGIAYFCESQTKGFRLQEILSDIPNNSRWEVAPLSSESVRNIQAKLQQKFRYLGSGEQSHAFLGEDQKTVLKFFRHNDLSVLKMLKHFPDEVQVKFWNFFKNYDPRHVFDSSKLAYEMLQDETGLHYLHINKTKGRFGLVKLNDNSGVAHTVDLDETEFMVQDYCELATVRINAQMKSGNLNAARATVEALFTSIEDWSRRGIHIDNPALKRNIGFCGDRVIMLDVGSLKKRAPVKTPEHFKREIKHVTRELGRWIYKHHPALFPSYEDGLSKL
jgi:hypothetical protein